MSESPKCGNPDPSSLEFRLGDEERTTGMYKPVHEDCERRSQQRLKPKCGHPDPSSLEFRLGDEERTTGMYKPVHEDCERRSQQRLKPKCEGSIVEIFTDGACRGNPGPGGWGAYMRYRAHEKKLYGAEPLTTNNRMELTAVIEALASLKKPCIIHLTTDSMYVRNGVTIWITDWKKRNWKTSSKKSVKNKELWQRLDEEVKRHKISWHWVKGHNGHYGNEIADALANQAIDEL